MSDNTINNNWEHEGTIYIGENISIDTLPQSIAIYGDPNAISSEVMISYNEAVELRDTLSKIIERLELE